MISKESMIKTSPVIANYEVLKQSPSMLIYEKT